MIDEPTAGDAPVDLLVEVAPESSPEASPEARLEAAQRDHAEKLAAAEKDKKELNERFLRTAADFDNYRKRARKELDDARAKAREDVLREMLPVVDNLERALQAAGSGAAASAAIADGVKLVLRQFGGALDRFDVKSFPSVGEAFDPARHEAISQVETAELPPGSVVTELQRGYLMGGKLLRPAMVAVARPPSTPAPVPAPAGGAAGASTAEPPVADAAPASEASAADTAPAAVTDEAKG